MKRGMSTGIAAVAVVVATSALFALVIAAKSAGKPSTKESGVVWVAALSAVGSLVAAGVALCIALAAAWQQEQSRHEAARATLAVSWLWQQAEQAFGFGPYIQVIVGNASQRSAPQLHVTLIPDASNAPPILPQLWLGHLQELGPQSSGGVLLAPWIGGISPSLSFILHDQRIDYGSIWRVIIRYNDELGWRWRHQTSVRFDNSSPTTRAWIDIGPPLREDSPKKSDKTIM